MAEDKPKPELNNSVLWPPIFLVLIILLLGTIVERNNLIGEVDENRLNPGQVDTTAGEFSFSGLLGKGDLSLGKNIINIRETAVRQFPGGSILGFQKKLEIGKLMEGPVDQFGVSWWRINYEDAPDGWVDSDFVSAKITGVKAINIFPILYEIFKPVGYILSFFLLILLILIKLMLGREGKVSKKQLEVKDELAAKRREVQKPIEDFSKDEKIKNPQWEHVQTLIKTENPNDWRQAVIEADIMLDEMLRKMSYKGLSIGDMLKTVERTDFATLDKAWEAHKFRNEIAHTGSSFAFSKAEAERVIKLYQDVFDEFYMI